MRSIVFRVVCTPREITPLSRSYVSMVTVKWLAICSDRSNIDLLDNRYMLTCLEDSSLNYEIL